MNKCKKCDGLVYSNKSICYDCDLKLREEQRKIYEINNQRLSKIVKELPQSNYIVDIELKRLEVAFNDYANDYGGFDYNPDFQRGHVWSKDKQIAYMESYVSGLLGDSQKTITLNCPEFNDNSYNLSNGKYTYDESIKGFCIIDGLQRVTAIISFIKGEYPIFGGLYVNDFNNSKYSLFRKTIKVQVFGFLTKKELLEYYIKINSGGVVHTDEEINKVKNMLKELK